LISKYLAYYSAEWDKKEKSISAAEIEEFYKQTKDTIAQRRKTMRRLKGYFYENHQLFIGTDGRLLFRTMGGDKMKAFYSMSQASVPDKDIQHEQHLQQQPEKFDSMSFINEHYPSPSTRNDGLCVNTCPIDGPLLIMALLSRRNVLFKNKLATASTPFYSCLKCIADEIALKNNWTKARIEWIKFNKHPSLKCGIYDCYSTVEETILRTFGMQCQSFEWSSRCSNASCQITKPGSRKDFKFWFVQ